MVKISIDPENVKHLNDEVLKKLLLKVFGQSKMEHEDRDIWKAVLISELNRRRLRSPLNEYEISCPPHPTTPEELAQ